MFVSGNGCEGMTGEDGSVAINRWSEHPYYFINGSLDERVIKSLKREMSYMVANCQRTTAFQQGKWDGRECLLYKTKKGVYYFPTGMIDCAKRVLNDFGIEYFVQDIKLDNVRKKYQPLDLKWTGLELRDYQKKAVIDIQNSEGGTICLPTGSGKTLAMLRIAYEYDLPFIVIVHTKELLYQWERTVKDYFDGYTPGLVGDGNSHFDSKITIAMLQTVHQLITKGEGERLSQYPVLFFDEVHRVAADTAYEVAMHINSPARIGSSATPQRIDGKEKKLWAAVGEIKSRITADELIKQGILAKPKFIFLTPPAVHIGRGTKWHDAYLQGIVLNEGRNDLIIKVTKELAAQELTVYVHVERIDHGEMLHGRLPGSVFLSGSDNSTRRQLVLKDFEDGKIKILISTLLREGVSINSMNCFVAAGGMKSPIGVIQRIGRALRIAPGKTEAVIVDFRDSGRYLGDHFQERYETYCNIFGDYVT
jgi:superfamily II DNA or RNA helicase